MDVCVCVCVGMYVCVCVREVNHKCPGKENQKNKKENFKYTKINLGKKFKNSKIQKECTYQNYIKKLGVIKHSYEHYVWPVTKQAIGHSVETYLRLAALLFTLPPLLLPLSESVGDAAFTLPLPMAFADGEADDVAVGVAAVRGMFMRSNMESLEF